jgi:hypothetical protein
LITWNLPHLHTFKFKYQEIIEHDFEITPNHALINRFNTSFWIERKWHLRICMEKDDDENDLVIYSTFPYGYN